jgi:F-type H+-transporting ATPase subunit alpha
MTVALWTGTTGRLDKVPVDDVRRFEQEFLDYLHRSHAQILDTIRESRKFEDDTASSLEDAYNSFLDQFETSEGGSIKVGHEPQAEALEDEDVEQEQIVKQKRG